MGTAVTSLIVLVVCFIAMGIVIFYKPEDIKKKSIVFIPFSESDIDSIENDVRTLMKKIDFKTVKKVYIINRDNNIGVLKICRILCREYPLLDICSIKDIPTIMDY